ncbi:uncharacterized protein AMSG_04623 [Thecamonas trahens ATCC 50062]|uniref:Pherophorin domain-containing protein n=1 Tax=Thecamonas trahens ATCC 50062 TaxID=461836 RepID=A0A0L0DC45_THETB|nr:hypothetical protein AMSG_04623 [Thecamonas trahens ATCC 50062]KNC48878.1 hypothetical protein AMSG_04623 [Thecamonas trahens ATCC 50062]|eukprot:XP_013758298.1 hypothetical protein AMSG_04623 [Thecamonas trahens ATCC 50062]
MPSAYPAVLAVVLALGLALLAAASSDTTTPPPPAVMPATFFASFEETVYKDGKPTNDPVADGFFGYTYTDNFVASITFRNNGIENPVCQLVQTPSTIAANASCTQYAYGDGSRTITYGESKDPDFCCVLQPAGSFWGPVLPNWAAAGSYVGNVTVGDGVCALYEVKAATPNAVDTISIEWGTGRLCGIGNAGGHGLLTVMVLNLDTYSPKPLPEAAFDVPAACGSNIAKCVFKS